MKVIKLLLICIICIAAWVAAAIYLALNGTWITSVATPGDETGFYDWAVNEIKSENRGTSALVLLNGGGANHQYFGEKPMGVDGDTLFPTASFSKLITALSVMSLVENKQIDLDAPVAHYLTRWQLPESEFDNNEVTVRRLLSHTAGLTDGLGFGDYNANETIPAVEEELRNPRASRGDDVKVAVGIEPGSEFQYSGGGYLILQLVVEEVSGLLFADYVKREVLEPVGMSRSSYTYLGNEENVSPSYHPDGSLAPTFQYASPAATGFASTGNDLTKLASSLLETGDSIPLTPDTIEAMREPHGFLMGSGIWGLGTILYAQSSGGDFVFGHDGANDPAINSTLRLNPETRDGIVVLVSGHPSLASNIGSEWVLWQTGRPDILQTEKALKSALVPILAGALIVILAVFLWSRRHKLR